MIQHYYGSYELPILTLKRPEKIYLYHLHGGKNITLTTYYQNMSFLKQLRNIFLADGIIMTKVKPFMPYKLYLKYSIYNSIILYIYRMSLKLFTLQLVIFKFHKFKLLILCFVQILCKHSL